MRVVRTHTGRLAAGPAATGGARASRASARQRVVRSTGVPDDVSVLIAVAGDRAVGRG